LRLHTENTLRLPRDVQHHRIGKGFIEVVFVLNHYTMGEWRHSYTHS